MKKILFVCTGNTFRSVAAEYSFNKYNKDPNFKAESAGTQIMPGWIENPELKNTRLIALEKNQLSIEGHNTRRINRKMLEDADLIVAMAKDHKECMEKVFGVKCHLYNDVCNHDQKSVPDVEDVLSNWRETIEAAKQHIFDTIDYIDSTMPKFIENMHKFI